MFNKFSPEEEKIQRIAHLLIEMFKIRRSINILNMHPEKADKYFKRKWSKPVIGYRIIKKLCQLKSSGIMKKFKELPMLECEDNYAKAMNLSALTDV